MTRTVIPQGTFALAAALRFLDHFPSVRFAAPTGHDHLHLAIVVEGEWAPAAICVAEGPDGVVVRSAGPGAGSAAEDQAVRILSLDLDGTGFDDRCAQDPVLRAARARHPGLRPVLFGSVLEALTWALVSQRTRAAQARDVVGGLTRSLGAPVRICGERLTAPPTPTAMAGLATPVPGLPAVKAQRLREVAARVEAQDLTAVALRDDPDAATRLTALPGIGPFSADLALIRGAGRPDTFPVTEPRLHGVMRMRYGLPDADTDRLAQVAEAWRPFRSWASFLLRNDA